MLDSRSRKLIPCEVTNVTAFRRLVEIFAQDQDTLRQGYSNYFRVYFRNFLGSDFAFYCQMARSLVSRMEAGDQIVADLGCGFGILDMLIGLFGAKEVIGVDLSQEKVAVANKIICELGLTHVSILHGDALKSDLPREHFDIVIATEVVSHVHDLNRFFEEAHSILKVGGRFYIADENNALDIRGRILRRRFWQMVERGPLRREVGADKPYAKMREDFIRKNFPMIGDKDLCASADGTKGLWGDQIIKAVQLFLQGRPFEKSPCFPYLNPLTGEHLEHEYNPLVLKSYLNRKGFQARVIHPHFYPKSKMKSFVSRWLTALHPVSLIVSPGFEITAIKTTSNTTQS